MGNARRPLYVRERPDGKGYDIREGDGFTVAREIRTRESALRLAAASNLLEACEEADVAIRNVCLMLERGDLVVNFAGAHADAAVRLARTDREISGRVRAAIRAVTA